MPFLESNTLLQSVHLKRLSAMVPFIMTFGLIFCFVVGLAIWVLTFKQLHNANTSAVLILSHKEMLPCMPRRCNHSPYDVLCAFSVQQLMTVPDHTCGQNT